MGHPVLKLTEQFRYRSVFAAWPNVRTYDGLLKSHPSTQTIVVNSQFNNALKEVLCVENATLNLGNIVVSVEGSLCEVDEASKSRYNDPHRLFILQLLLANVRHGGYRGGDITVITTLRSSHPTKPKLFSDLGFTTGDHRGTVGLTRMTEVMINLLPESVGTGLRAVAPADRHNYLGERIVVQTPYPCAFMQWAQSEKIVLPVECPEEGVVILVPRLNGNINSVAEGCDVAIEPTASRTSPFTMVKAIAAFCFRALLSP